MRRPCSTRRTAPIRGVAPGAPPTPSCASTRGARSWSPTRTPRRKKVDRGRLPHRRGDGPLGLVHRPGRAVPDGPPGRLIVVPRGAAGPPATRVYPQWHGQGPDAVPPRRWRARVKGVTSCPNAVLHGWLKEELTTILASLPTPPAAVSMRGTWERWRGAGRLRLRPRCRHCGCCWCWTTWPGTRHRSPCCGSSPTGSCRCTRRWAGRG